MTHHPSLASPGRPTRLTPRRCLPGPGPFPAARVLLPSRCYPSVCSAYAALRALACWSLPRAPRPSSLSFGGAGSSSRSPAAPFLPTALSDGTLFGREKPQRKRPVLASLGLRTGPVRAQRAKFDPQRPRQRPQCHSVLRTPMPAPRPSRTCTLSNGPRAAATLLPSFPAPLFPSPAFCVHASSGFV
jgi:hypothetical protein